MTALGNSPWQGVITVDVNGNPVGPSAGGAGSSTVAIDQTTPGTTNRVDTELPAAILAADGLALPTAPQVQGLLVAPDAGGGGTPLNMVKSQAWAGDGNSSAKALLVKATLHTNAGYALGSGQDALDGSSNNGARAILNVPILHNGQNYDRQRNNHEVTLLASAARTATVTGSDQTNYNESRLVYITIDVTAGAAAPGLTPTIQMKDSLSGKYITLHAALTKIIATGTYVYAFGAGVPVAAGGITAVSGFSLPRIWRLVMTADDATSYTYSVSANYLAS